MGRAGVEGVSFYEVATAGPERIAFPGPGEPVTYGALHADASGAVAGEELAAALLAHCEPRLARIKHPRRIEFRASLPRTPSGKLSRSRVRDDYLRESGDQGEQPVG